MEIVMSHILITSLHLKCCTTELFLKSRAHMCMNIYEVDMSSALNWRYGTLNMVMYTNSLPYLSKATIQLAFLIWLIWYFYN